MSEPNTRVPFQFRDHTQLSVNYPIDVRKRLINVDSRFREDYANTTSSSYSFRIANPVKNITSIRIASVEIPNTWYEISYTSRTSFFTATINGIPKEVRISDGNYSAVTLMAAVQASLNAIATSMGIGPFVVQFVNTPSSKVSIQVPAGVSVVFDFDATRTPITVAGMCDTSTTSTRPTDWGLGYILGFRQRQYSVVGVTGPALVAEGYADLAGPNYIFLNIDELRCIENTNKVSGTDANIAKIIVSVDKGAMIYDDGSNLLTKEVVFPSPQNLTAFTVQLKNAYGEILDLNKMEWSFTIEATEILNSQLYEEYRQHLVYNPGN